MNKSIFNSTFWFGCALFSIIAFLILRYIPDFYLELYQTSAYMESGQIGDIVGGTTNPIIAIGAAFLTFLAFWMQYKANRQQRDDISLERFESNLYEMLHLHRENLFDLSCGKSNGRNAVLALCYKLKILYYLIDSIIELWPETDKKLFLYYCDKYNYSQSEAKNIIASNLLFYGANFSYSYDGKSNERKLYDKLSRVIENFESDRTKISNKGCYDEHTFNLLSENISQFINEELTIDEVDKMVLPDSLLCGYNEKLGVYYRHLYQIAKFVALKEGISEQMRYQYMRLLRSQLSDYEQVLLYYNSLTKIGEAWDECLIANDLKYKCKLWVKIRSCIYRLIQDWHKYKLLAIKAHKDSGTNTCASFIKYLLQSIREEWKNPSFTLKIGPNEYWKCQMGLISRFRLIKNIPVSFSMFGYIPETKYLHDIIAYKNHNERFFEAKEPVIFGVPNS